MPGGKDKVDCQHAAGKLTVREHMAAYKYRRQVAFIDELPATGSGRVLCRLLRDKDPGK